MRVVKSNNEPIDFCKDCRPNKWDAYNEYGHNQEVGPDGRGNCYAYDAEHQDYTLDWYKCAICGVLLDETD